MDALTAKLGKLSKPQIILTAAGAGIAMAIAYRLADRTLDSVLPKKKPEEEETLDDNNSLEPTDNLLFCWFL